MFNELCCETKWLVLIATSCPQVLVSFLVAVVKHLTKSTLMGKMAYFGLLFKGTESVAVRKAW